MPKSTEPPSVKTRHRIPSLAQLALKYGTITTDQLNIVHREMQQREAEGKTGRLDRILIQKKMATPYQVNLLQLIQEFMVVKKRSEQFGEIAVNRGYATQEEVELALIRQKQLFREQKIQKMLGDLLVEFGVITEAERQIVAKEQERMEEIVIDPIEHAPKKTEETVGADTVSPSDPDTVSFEEAERDFIRLKALDTDFALRVLEKRFATVEAVEAAMTAQNEWFEKFRKLHLLGDIMVAEGVLTEKEKLAILMEQKRKDDALPSLSPISELLPSTADSNGTPPDHHNSPDDEAPSPSFLPQTAPETEPPDPADSITVHLSKSRMEAWINISKSLLADSASEKEILDVEAAEIIEKDVMAVSDPLEANEGLRAHQNPDFQPHVITLDLIKAVLAKNGITQGILSDALIQSHLDDNASFFPVALGSYTFDTKLEYLFDIHHTGIDQKSAPFKRNKTLAYIKGPPATLRMTDVMGKPIKKAPVSPGRALLRCGKGVTLSEKGDRILSAKGGTPGRSVEGRIYLFPPLNVLGDADARYGPLDSYSDIAISGILTGAYNVTAGSVRAGEIRGCTLETVGDITADLGIIDCTIITQGSVRAKYIHHCRIQAFGDVMPEHELIDSTVTVSGRFHAPKSRIIASTVSAKQGISVAGIGSDVTEPCRLFIGREDHIKMAFNLIDGQMEEIAKSVDALKKKRKALMRRSQTLFEKMVELKRLHDRAENKSKQYYKEMENEEKKQAAPSLEKTRSLIKGLEKKMGMAVASIRRYNNQKKETDAHMDKLETMIKTAKIRAEKKTFFLELDRKRLVQWAENHDPRPEISVSGRIAQGSVITGQFSTLSTMEDHRNVHISEHRKAMENDIPANPLDMDRDDSLARHDEKAFSVDLYQIRIVPS